jgi:EmrB/QacA subfamily drug resistance transporter
LTTEIQSSERSRVIAWLVAAVFFIQLLDGTILATSLPQMAASFGTDAVALGIGFTVYLLTMAGFIPLAGWLADRIGAREVLVAAVVAFAAASLLCGAATSLEGFVAARALQGTAAALMVPVGRNLVLQNTPKSGVMQAIATITWPALTAPVVGPFVGGWITTHFGWQWNFYVNLPLCLAAAVLFVLLVPRQPRPAPRRFDWLGFLLVSGCMVLAVAGLEALVAHRPGAGATLLASGIGLGWLAVGHLRRTEAPLFELEVLSIRTFALATLAAGSFGRIAVNATPFLLPLLLQVGFGLSAVETGSLVLVYFLGNLAMKSVTTPIMRRFGFRTVLLVNGLLLACTIGAFAVIPADLARPALLVLLFAAGAARSLQFTALNTLTFADIDARHRSAATTLSSMFQQAAMVLGVALAVAAVRLAQVLHGGEGEAAADFRAAFAAMALIALASAMGFLGLHPDSGDEVAGRRGPSVRGRQT